MATQNLAANATESPNNWNLAVGSDKVTAVETGDGDTSYINSTATSGTEQQFTLADPTIEDYDTISSVSTRSSCKRGGGSNGNFIMSIVHNGGTVTDGAEQTSTSAYSTFTSLYITNPVTGSAWTKSDITGASIRIRNTQTRDVRCSLFFLIVNYTAGTPPAVAAVARRKTLLGVGT